MLVDGIVCVKVATQQHATQKVYMLCHGIFANLILYITLTSAVSLVIRLKCRDSSRVDRLKAIEMYGIKFDL